MREEHTVNVEKVEVRGMSCGSCVARLERVLQRLDGVEIDRVEVGAVYLPGESAAGSRPRVLEAIRTAGFEPA